MSKLKLSKSLRKYIRSEKARIRRGALDSHKQIEFISGLYAKVSGTRQKKQQKPADKQDNIIPAAAGKVLSVKQ